MKKLCSILLCMIIVVGCGIPACAASRRDQIMSDDDETRILEQYVDEIFYISMVSNVSIDRIDSFTLDTIKKVAFGPKFNDESYRFKEMMEEITLAVLAYKDMQTASPTGIIVPGTHTREVLATGRLYAAISDQIPVGATYSYSYNDSITVSVGSNVQGYTLSTQYSCGKTITTSFSGPADGTKLVNGKYATNRIVFVVLSGSLVHEKWDYINDVGQLIESDNYFIESSTASTSIHTTLASFSASSNYWGIETENRASVKTYSSENAALNDLRSYPNKFA